MKRKKILLSVIILAMLSSCALYDLNEFVKEAELTQAQEITSSQNSITLAWDAPPGSVLEYRIYHKAHGAQQWKLLKTVEGSEQEATIQYAELTVSAEAYDFAVSAVINGVESSLHSSLA